MTNVFISSTSKDLAEYRQAAINACLELSLFPVAMEHFEAMDKGATAASLKKLDECNLYVGIFAFRYGYIEDGHPKSVTELEFDGAEERTLERICFVSDPKHPFPPEFIDSNREKIDGFRERITKKLVVKFFGSVDDFKAKLIPSLVAWKESHPAAPAKGTTTVSSGKGLVRHADDVPRRARKFIGRTTLRDQIHEHLNAGKTVLLQGFGGMGKSALSAEIAAERIKDSDSVMWLEVGDSPPDALLQALARPFGREREVASAGDEAVDVVRAILRESDVRLVVLDDVWNGAALYTAVQALPRNLPLLATARRNFPLDEILHVDKLPKDEAWALLTQHAGRVHEGADDLCKELGCLPFALEIAGKTLKMRFWSPSELLAKLGNELHTMTVPMGFHEEGRENVAALLETSLKALDEDARRVFMAFGALFAPSATPELLDPFIDLAMGKMRVLPHPPTVETALDTLCDQGLAQRVPADDENVAYCRIHDLAYDYATAHATPEMREAAVQFCLAYTIRYNKPSLENFRKLRPELDNFMGAAAYAYEREHWQVAEHFAWNLYTGSQILDYRGLYTVAQTLLRQAADAAHQRGDRPDEGKHLGNLGLICFNLGQYDKAIEFHTQALTISRAFGNRLVEGNDLGNLGNVYNSLGQYDKSIKYYRQALDIVQTIGDKRSEGNWFSSLGNGYFSLKQYSKAIEYHTQSLEISRAIGNKQGEGQDLGNLGNVYFALNKYDEAIEYHVQALAISRAIGDRQGEGSDLNNLGTVYAKKSDVPRALDYFRQARAIYTLLGLGHLVEQVDRNIAIVRRKMSDGQGLQG